MKPYLIVNPASAGGRTGRHFDRIARAVRRELGDFECAFTKARGDGRNLAVEAVRAGGELVVAVGGDGTASEVIDGLLAGDGPATFGYIPRGTGGDLRRTLGWPDDPAGAARVIAAGRSRVCDLGLVELTRPDGSLERRHFANVAGFGISGRVVARMERRSGLLPGRLAFMLASARALAGWQDQPVRWRADGGPWREDRVTALSICNGRYFGGGMMVAPEARMDDGLFDVTVWKGLGLGDFALKKSMLYDGTHVRLPNTTRLRARSVEAEPLEGAEVLLDVDGEQPGRLPARFTILPGALRICAG
ncbi:diacylglycerol/lipid kinase family protein [Anaeromyxobacter paludicola]|uniref:Diacylglycerol kinase n=1 Tax=Anaeromyxobacter paludicola TaxID=2918171 RepID=A0ABM7X5K7_9BACT|nr:diacylglycerol kinase family protein [Anaeromyxobacter paludicola]BDG07096.1 diacylglycerol kinase [Anaeromyxobacter paludicola]